MNNLIKQSIKFSPYVGFKIFLYLNLLVGAVITVCALAVVTHVGLHDFFYNPKVFKFLQDIKHFGFEP